MKLLGKIIVCFIPALVVSVITATILHNPETNAIMENSLMENFGEVCYGSCGFWGKHTITSNFTSTNELYAPYVFIRYFFIILVGFAPFFLLSFNSKLKIKILFFKNFNNLLYPVLIILTPILVLFSMGTDWGRWVNISYTFIILFYFYLFKNNLLEVNLDKITRKMSFFDNKKVLLILCFIIYAFGWTPQTGMTGDVSSIPGYRIPYKSGKILYHQILLPRIKND